MTKRRPLTPADVYPPGFIETAGDPPGSTTLFEAFVRQERALVARGWHSVSDWWLEQLEHFWNHPTAYCFVEEVGRRGGKTTTFGRIVACELLDRAWRVPPGDPNHVFPVFSVKQGYAVEILSIVESILGVRKIRYRKGTDKISPFLELESRPLTWRAMPASFRTAVSFTAVGFATDELARWIDNEASVNPASHVLSAVRPSVITHLEEGAHEYLISSPMVEEGAHWEAMQLGNTEDQVVAHAETWIAHPAMTPELCQRLCRQEQESGQDSDFDRDYRAIPTPLSAVGRLDPALIRWLDRPPQQEVGDQRLSGSDLAMKTNSSAQLLGLLRADQYIITEVHEWQPFKGQMLQPTVVCKEQRSHMERHGAMVTCADGHYVASLWEAFIGTELTVTNPPNSSVEAYVRLRALMQDGKVGVYAGELKNRLERQLRGTRLIPTPNGLRCEMWTAQDGSHCDLVAALALLVWQRAGNVLEESEKLPEGWSALELGEMEDPKIHDAPEEDWSGGDSAWEGWTE